MSDASIALNRFGLGARPGDSAIDSRRWLLGQLDRFDAKPAPIAALPTTESIARTLADYLVDLREAQREARQNPPAQSQNQRRPAGYTQPRMSDEAMMGDAAAMQGDTEPKDDANTRDPVAQLRRFVRQQGRDIYSGAVNARTLASLNSPAPFVERLVHFWANHFAVSIDKFIIVGLAGQLEFDAIRPNVLGSFHDMLFAVERHPAMLLYLDQAGSIGPNSPAGQRLANRPRADGQRGGLNENLAREILELHTLGVRTGYTQNDVTEFARAMTGWTVAGLTRGLGARWAGVDGKAGDFVFAAPIHEPGTRTILGKSWAQEGYRQAASVLEMLAVHPSTAHHIATKLARHFAGDEPPPALVARLEKRFLETSGDLPSLYRVLIESPECWAPAPAKFKTPWEWSVSSLRALGSRDLEKFAAVGLMRQLGQPVWQPGSPAGWDDVGPAWAGPDAIMRRVEAAERIAARTRDQVDARTRAAEIFPGTLSNATAQSIARAESPGQGVALMLVSPEMMRR
jgi:uncharacterized protein (DUF1800 family)